MPIVTVLLTSYNHGDYIRGSIESILNQTFKDFELILVNDGSADSSKQICVNCQSKDDRIIVNQRNSGVSTARYLWLNLAKGEFIRFVDADDYVEKRVPII